MLAVASIPITPADVAAAYAAKDLSPVALGDLMLRCRRELGISMMELARRSGITPGTLHHYESCALLPEPYRGYAASGKLGFKESRSLADLDYHDPRFAEIASLFVYGRLTSVYVERVVHEAKRDPSAAVDVIVERALSDAPRKPKTWTPTDKQPRPLVDVTAIKEHMLALAGEIEAWGMGEHCEVERLPVIAAARVLDDRLHRLALVATPANETLGGALGGLLGQRRSALLTEEPDRRPRNGQGNLL